MDQGLGNAIFGSEKLGPRYSGSPIFLVLCSNSSPGIS